jgi:hypothetical protein
MVSYTGVGAVEQGEVVREELVLLVADAVAGADLHLLEGVEHVELGDGQAGEAVDLRSIADDDSVEPAAAAGPAGGGAVLAAEGRGGVRRAAPQSRWAAARCRRGWCTP